MYQLMKHILVLLIQMLTKYSATNGVGCVIVGTVVVVLRDIAGVGSVVIPITKQYKHTNVT